MRWREASVPLMVAVGLALLVWYRSELRRGSATVVDVAVNLCGFGLIVLFFRLSGRQPR